jgi:hypothetical protein
LANIFVSPIPIHTGIPVHRNTFALNLLASSAPNPSPNSKNASSIEYTSITPTSSLRIDITRADISPYNV